MQVISSSETRPPRLGVVLLDLPHLSAEFGLFSPVDPEGLGTLPFGWFECPATWPIATAYMAAPGATPAATLAADPVAVAGVRTAVEYLSEFADLVIGDCGFFWAASDSVRKHASAILLSGLDLIDLAAGVTERDVGILTYSEHHLEPLLQDHSLRSRLRILGMSDRPEWAYLADEEYGVKRLWTREGLAAELHDALAGSLRSGGVFANVGSIVIECTVMPQFRPLIRSITNLPVFDVSTAAVALLETQTWNPQPLPTNSERTTDESRT